MKKIENILCSVVAAVVLLMVPCGSLAKGKGKEGNQGGQTAKVAAEQKTQETDKAVEKDKGKDKGREGSEAGQAAKDARQQKSQETTEAAKTDEKDKSRGKGKGREGSEAGQAAKDAAQQKSQETAKTDEKDKSKGKGKEEEAVKGKGEKAGPGPAGAAKKKDVAVEKAIDKGEGARKGLAKGKEHQQQLKAIEKRMVHEQAKHMQHRARLERIRQLATEKGDTKTVERVDKLLQKEQLLYVRKQQQAQEQRDKFLQTGKDEATTTAIKAGEKGAVKDKGGAKEVQKSDEQRSGKAEKDKLKGGQEGETGGKEAEKPKEEK